jgi:hypothetical protein
MRSRTMALTGALTVAALLLLTTSALAGLRAPEGTAALGATLADDDGVREAVADALVEALLEDAAERDPLTGGLLPLIRPVLVQVASTAIDSPAGRAALASALTDALRQLTFSGPIVVDLRAAALVAADAAPAPLDSLARAAVEQGSVGVVVIGGEEGDASRASVPSEDELRRVAGMPAGLALALSAALLVVLMIALIGRDAALRPRRLLLAGAPLLLVGAAVVTLLRTSPASVIDRALTDRDVSGPMTELLELLADGLVALLATTARLATGLAVVGFVLMVEGIRGAVSRR